MRRIVGRTLDHDDFVVAECLFVDAAQRSRQCGGAVTRCDDNAEAWNNGPPRATLRGGLHVSSSGFMSWRNLRAHNLLAAH
jgi:hypothetical protein